MRRWIRALLAKLFGYYPRNPDPRFDAERLPAPERPINCPHCGGKLETATDDTRREIYLCVGLSNRAEVERYLAPEFPGGRVPKDCQSKPACGWRGYADEWRRTWV